MTSLSRLFSVSDSQLIIRSLRLEDEAALRAAVRDFRNTNPDLSFAFLFDGDTDFAEYLQLLEDQSQGKRLINFVPHTFLVAVVESRIVGRISIRHELNENLAECGGHVGYMVLQSERGKGYATAMLKYARKFCSDRGIDRILISCDVDNVASRRVIEKNGGQYERTTNLPDLETQKRIYWINISQTS